jgi:hypothetical protein
LIEDEREQKTSKRIDDEDEREQKTSKRVCDNEFL